MLTTYFDRAVQQAVYKKLGGGTWFGEIPALSGLWADEASVDEWREDLRGALKDWVLVALRQNIPLPVID
jgi:predicted RNase H-like HicB family nuclease